MATMYHAHPNANHCVVPPAYKVQCPYGLASFAEDAKGKWASEAIAYAYDTLAQLTTEDFRLGKDRNARIALTEAYENLAGRTLWADHPESCEL